MDIKIYSDVAYWNDEHKLKHRDILMQLFDDWLSFTSWFKAIAPANGGLRPKSDEENAFYYDEW